MSTVLAHLKNKNKNNKINTSHQYDEYKVKEDLGFPDALFYEPTDLHVVSGKTDWLLEEWIEKFMNQNCDETCKTIVKTIYSIIDKKNLNEKDKNSNKENKNLDIIEELKAHNIKFYRSGKIIDLKQLYKENDNIKYVYKYKNDPKPQKGCLKNLYYIYNNKRVGINIDKKNDMRFDMMKKLLQTRSVHKKGYFICLGYFEGELWHFSPVIGGKKIFKEHGVLEENIECLEREVNEETGLKINQKKLRNLNNINSNNPLYLYEYNSEDKFEEHNYESLDKSNNQRIPSRNIASVNTFIYCKDINVAKDFLNKCKFGELGLDSYYTLELYDKITLCAFSVEYLQHAYHNPDDEHNPDNEHNPDDEHNSSPWTKYSSKKPYKPRNNYKKSS